MPSSSSFYVISNPFISCVFGTWRGPALIRLANAACAASPTDSGKTKGAASPLHFQQESTGFGIISSRLLKGACYLPELQRITIADRCGLIRLHAFAVDVCSICAVQIHQRIGAADMLKGSMNT